jgi:hypothetical protein
MACFQKAGMHEAAARHNIPNPFYPTSPPVLPPPYSFSLPCLPQSTPLLILPLRPPALQFENCRPFLKFGLSRFGSAFSPTAAWLGRSTPSRHLKVIRAWTTKSKPVASPHDSLAEGLHEVGANRGSSLWPGYNRSYSGSLSAFASWFCLGSSMRCHSHWTLSLIVNYSESERSHKAQKRGCRDVMAPLSSHEAD